MRKLWLLAASIMLAASACSSGNTAAQRPSQPPPATPTPLSSLHAADPEISQAANPPNCGKNATMHCGFTSAADWITKYNNGDGVHSSRQLQKAYIGFGITPKLMQKAVLGALVFSGNPAKKWVALVPGTEYELENAFVGFPDNGHTKSVGSLSMTPITHSYSYPVQAMVYAINGQQFRWAVVLSDGDPVVIATGD
jgi:hypothetical protein